MQLTIRDAARLLQTNESAVHRWVKEQGLPAEQIGGRYRFNKAELLEWASLRKIPFSPNLIAGNGNATPRLHDALVLGGIHDRVPGADKTAVLREVVCRMPLPTGYDREFLLQVLLCRESQGSTGLGDGLALPHPRYPVVLPFDRPFLTLCFLQQPVVYSAPGAPQPQQVHTLFALVCPTVRTHLALLARLAYGLQDVGFRDLIKRQATAEEILAQVALLDKTLREDPDQHVAEGP